MNIEFGAHKSLALDVTSAKINQRRFQCGESILTFQEFLAYEEVKTVLEGIPCI